METKLSQTSKIRMIKQPEVLYALIVVMAVFAFIYPELFFLRQSPMGGNPLTLKDPTVSWTAFMPAFRDFRYELLEHTNLLWSNSRGLGQPLLGNTVQGAPLFPLNLLLLPLPDSLYWSIMPIARILLIGLGCFLIARNVVGLSIGASLFFALLIGFNINTVRWMNHPWTNGFLAGIWYYYYSCRICLAQTKTEKIIAVIGLVTGVFAMITTGFPEAAAMSALLFGLLFIGFLFTYWKRVKSELLVSGTLLLTCHFIGFGLSSIQIFALLEFIEVAGALELRSEFVSGSYQSSDLQQYFLAQISPFGTNTLHQTFLTFSMGFWGIFFAIRAVIMLLTGRFYRTNDIQSHFPLYFSPLFFTCFSLLSALGFHDFVSNQEKNNIDKGISLFTTTISALLGIYLICLSLNVLYKIPFANSISTVLNKPQLFAAKFFLISSLILVLLQASNLYLKFNKRLNKKGLSLTCATVMLSATAYEIQQSVPKTFSDKDFIKLNVSNDIYAFHSLIHLMMATFSSENH